MQYLYLKDALILCNQLIPRFYLSYTGLLLFSVFYLLLSSEYAFLQLSFDLVTDMLLLTWWLGNFWHPKLLIGFPVGCWTAFIKCFLLFQMWTRYYSTTDILWNKRTIAGQQNTWAISTSCLFNNKGFVTKWIKCLWINAEPIGLHEVAIGSSGSLVV